MIPSWDIELGKRISSLIEDLGGLKNASGVAGVSHDTLANWRDGRTEPRLFGLQAMCRAAGRSLDWLASGTEVQDQNIGDKGQPPFDPEHLRELITWTEKYLKENHLPMTPDERGQTIVALYKVSMREKAITGSQISSFEHFNELIDMIAS
tara:strand:+ start:179 stop:631 length:453 start_codon:yes stop_codon:yes gene_type:complete